MSMWNKGKIYKIPLYIFLLKAHQYMAIHVQYEAMRQSTVKLVKWVLKRWSDYLSDEGFFRAYMQCYIELAYVQSCKCRLFKLMQSFFNIKIWLICYLAGRSPCMRSLSVYLYLFHCSEFAFALWWTVKRISDSGPHWSVIHYILLRCCFFYVLLFFSFN